MQQALAVRGCENGGQLVDVVVKGDLGVVGPSISEGDVNQMAAEVEIFLECVQSEMLVPVELGPPSCKD
jgi:hypothetical protein